MATLEQTLTIRRTARVSADRQSVIGGYLRAARQRSRDRRALGAVASTTDVGRATGVRV